MAVAEVTEAYSTRLFERKIRQELESLVKSMFKDIIKAVERFTPKTLQDEKDNVFMDKIDFTRTPLQFTKTFNKLMEQWQEKFDEQSPALIKRLQRRLLRYINKKYKNLGIDFKGNSDELNMLMKGKSEEFLALIKSIPQEAITRISPVVMGSLHQADRQAVYKQIKEISNVTKRRARFIVRDQVAKNLEAINTGRARQLGLEYYYWDTQMDERVSTGKGGHKQLNGLIFKWDEPEAIIDSKGTKGHPKQRPNCRCRARWIILRAGQKMEKVKLGYKIVEDLGDKKKRDIQAPKDLGTSKKYK